MFPLMKLKKFNRLFIRHCSMADMVMNSWKKNKKMEYFKVWLRKIKKIMEEKVWQEFAMMTTLSMKVCLKKGRKMGMEG